jgi:hypothetical protein
MVGLRGLMGAPWGVAALEPARAGSRPYDALGTFTLPRPVIYQIPVFRTLCQARSVRARDGTAAPITIGRAFRPRTWPSKPVSTQE